MVFSMYRLLKEKNNIYSVFDVQNNRIQEDAISLSNKTEHRNMSNIFSMTLNVFQPLILISSELNGKWNTRKTFAYSIKVHIQNALVTPFAQV